MLVFDSVTKKFGRREILSNVSFNIDPGEFVCVTGPSGAGKSTIVHMLIRAEVPSSGKILVDGKDLRRVPAPMLQLYRRRTGVVFQDYKLLQDRTVAENVAFPMEVCGDSDAYIRKRVPELLDRVGLAGRADAYPHELSGGEKARVGIARALAHHPMIVIADEPTGNIDPEQSLEVVKLLKQVNAEGVTVVLATHDMALVKAVGARILHIANGTIERDSKSKASAKTEEEVSHQMFEKDAAKKGNGSDRGGKIRPIAIE